MSTQMPDASTDSFRERHIGPDADDIDAMLGALGHDSLDALIEAAVPAGIRDGAALDLPDPLTAAAATEALAHHASANRVLTSLIGMGYHDTITPPVVQRQILEDPSWYTAYTPYQPEISQGRLEALLNYQTMVCDLTGMEIANSSLLDEGTAAAEAMTLCRRVASGERNVFFVDADCHPQTIDVVETRAEPLGIKVVVGDPSRDLDPAEAYGVLVQYPGSSGAIGDLGAICRSMADHGGLVAVAADLLALCLLRSPGDLGADVVVGSSQRFGVPLGFGGPHAAFLATRESHKRSLPGRLVGVSVDDAGRPALRLALQTREQHIRRERATSNICTAQVLLAVTASMYAVWHGPDGLREIASRVNACARRLASGLGLAGIDVTSSAYFDTVTASVPGRADSVVAAAVADGINLRRVDADTVGVTFDECSDDALVDRVLAAFEAAVPGDGDIIERSWPDSSDRTEPFLDHPVFSSYRSETEMLRYMRRLSDRDVALDRSMIPLGSCTMKLNAAAEMQPISWPEFARLHPFAPLDQVSGYVAMIHELEDWLARCTGYDAVSVQPNAGSQGELAGLLAIRRYHESRGDTARTVCLIPSSAHGTNAASAVMAGLRVVVVECRDDGDVDLDDLRSRIDEHRDELAAIMVTYPSTHGVFEAGISELCELVHDAGGQVYVDGANLNALVGVAAPGRFGADVSHLNLHKTFCIPHGGGGPGVGPVAARAHLAPFLPNHRVVSEAGPDTGPGAISAAPWGSAGILPISWMYIAMMGAEGLSRATAVAILNANYLAARLADHFPVLFTGPGGLVAHECIVDLRPLADHVSVDDVAKRLIDYGFHAPTMSFPVPGTLMIEPTESESRAEIDRFCDAMIAIRSEIDRVASGEWPADDNPLVNAPHTAEDLLVDDWPHPYTRNEAAYPLDELRADKYWPPVGRIDGAYGDRNLVCACPDPRAFEDSATGDRAVDSGAGR